MTDSPARAAQRIFTVGHSNRTFEDFIGLLREYEIARVIDVRQFPHSQHNPQFNRKTLSIALRNRRIGYRHLEALGGRRPARPDSHNGAWENASFRGYADYMETREFEEALTLLVELARDRPAAIMCAEALPWRCHRSLIADALVARGFGVIDIIGPSSAHEHALPAFARVRSGKVTYPGEKELF